MISLSSIRTIARLFRGRFFHTGLFALISASLLAAPTLTYAQNPNKPTAKIMKPPKAEGSEAPAQAEAGVQSTIETEAPIEPTSISAIPFLTPTGPAWTALGPAPIPNGQTLPSDASGLSLTQAPVSGRVTAVAIDPGDPNTVYIGTAQGGLYQSRDGGATWIPLMDSAMTLAVGSLELDPSDPSTLLVGSGEANFSGDSYAGFGVYKLTALKTSSPVLTGPFGSSLFSKRGIPGLAIDPNNDDVVYVGTATAQQGIGPQAFSGAPARGLFRSTNFTTGAATFTKLAVANLPATFDFRVTSIVYEPGSSDRMFVGIADASGANDPNFVGGIYFTANASAATPIFTRVFETFSGHGGANPVPSDFAPIKLAIIKIGTKVTVVAVTGETADHAGNQGEAYKATYDTAAGKPSPVFSELPAAKGFAAGQGFYNLGVAIDPTNPKNIYVVGTIGGTFLFSRNGGGTFTASNDTLHVDSHMVGVAPSNPSVIYTGNDGGVWRSNDAGGHWIDLNNTTFSATQFQSVAVHPTDPKFTIGGTQDNGTDFFKPDGTWMRIDFGDGGYALIDQNAADTENVTMYHTYFNQTGNLIGFARVNKTHCATEGQWSFKGIYGGPVDPTIHCDGTTDTFNGILFSDPVNFYAPMALGPGNPNTVYFGTIRLYRSTDKGDSMTIVSQAFPSVVSAIGISRASDGIRIVGLDNGKVFATITGGATLGTMTDVTGTGMPAKYIARAVIDPNHSNTAYVVFNGNAILGKHVWRTTNLNDAGTGTVNWTAIDGSGIPDVSVNAFVVDPAKSDHLYAGTDRGVFNSTDGGATWSLYGAGLPDVAVFDLATSSDRHLRASTHGRGFYEIALAP